MWLADQAIRTSGLLSSDIPRERIGVLISQNSGEAAGTLTGIIIRGKHLQHHRRHQKGRAPHAGSGERHPTGDQVRTPGPGRHHPPGQTQLRRGRVHLQPLWVYGAQLFGFRSLHDLTGRTVQRHPVDPTTASSMQPSSEGPRRFSNALHFLEFSGLGALFGLSGQERPAHETSRPFDAQRDGMVLGEGGGIIVIERESLARARGALVHAVITGMGASNNHLGMVESSSVSQEMAIRASFRGLPYGPDAVDLVECHATSTRQGDVEEVRALKAFFNPPSAP